MLLWINGPFGVGKSQTAHELSRRLPGSVICDPEEVGYGLHRMLPPALRGDFKDLVAWRQGVFEVLDLVLTGRGRSGPVIAPMTMIEPDHFRETIERLRERGHDVRHFTLFAERETILRRLNERGLGQAIRMVLGKEAPPRRESFAVSRLDVCLEKLAAPEFAEHIDTERIDVAGAAERIAASVGLTLAPNTDGPLRGRLRRAGVGIRQIRIF
ncbi:AAA family ATPase [Embleya sp. NPDC005971]|uniref:AAA family ATPase n=1 Tax=unclassified Embleya TaxID=2699296 RepID=UPI00340540B1